MKKTINKIKGQPTEWQKMFANVVSDKGLISKIYKELTQINIKNPQSTQLKNRQSDNLWTGKKYLQTMRLTRD